MPLTRILRGRVRQGDLLLIWIILFTGAAVFSLYTLRNLASENQQRITEIQESRVVSCRKTYEGVRDVFRPFFVPAETQTEQQKRDVKKFNDNVDRLKRRCTTQVTTP